MKSMTGYGMAMKEYNGYSIKCEVISLNNKYLDAVFNLPEELKFYKIEMLNILKKYIKRGYIEVKIEINSVKDTGYKIDKEMLLSIVPEFKKLIEEFSLDKSLDLKTILSIPNILKREKFSDKNLIIEILQEAVKELIFYREKEGEKIKKSLEDKLVFISNEVENIMFESNQALKDKKEEVFKKLITLKELGLNFSKDDIEFLGFRGEIDEEIIRLKSHIDLLKEAINEENPVGKKIGFIIQEIQREVNTIGSKAILPGTVHRVIKIKEVVEEMKELSLNAE